MFFVMSYEHEKDLVEAVLSFTVNLPEVELMVMFNPSTSHWVVMSVPAPEFSVYYDIPYDVVFTEMGEYTRQNPKKELYLSRHADSDMYEVSTGTL